MRRLGRFHNIPQSIDNMWDKVKRV
jgi:hypothetical protein